MLFDQELSVQVSLAADSTGLPNANMCIHFPPPRGGEPQLVQSEKISDS